MSSMPEFARYRISILCEDKEHDYFVRSFFKSLGVGERKFTTYDLADGDCSAESHVRRFLPNALNKIRKNNENTFLVIVTDADTLYDMSSRVRQLNEELQTSGVTTMGKRDRVLCVIPKRNIETWFAWLDGEEPIDETTSYKLKYKNAKSAKYGKKFYQKFMTYRNGGIDCERAPESIKDMCGEFARFCEALKAGGEN